MGYLRRFSEENLVGIENICGLRSMCLENIRKKNFNLLFYVEKIIMTKPFFFAGGCTFSFFPIFSISPPHFLSILKNFVLNFVLFDPTSAQSCLR